MGQRLRSPASPSCGHTGLPEEQDGEQQQGIDRTEVTGGAQPGGTGPLLLSRIFVLPNLTLLWGAGPGSLWTDAGSKLGNSCFPGGLT